MAKSKTKFSKSEKAADQEAVVKNKRGYMKWLIPVGLVLLALFIIANASKSFYLVATVNGQPVYRHQLIMEMEKQYGSTLLDRKVTETLINQTAKEKGVEVDQSEITEQIATIEQNVTGQGTDLDTLLTQQGMTRESLMDQIRIQKLVEKLAPDPGDPSEDEIKSMLEQQSESFPEEMTEEERRQAVVDQFKQQQQSQVIQEWIASLKETADIQYLRSY